MIPSLFPFLLPLPLCFCLQPSRRPSLQPTFSLDCLSAPSPHHHCHPNQRFASQLSLCLGNPHPSSPYASSHLPTPPLYSSSLQFPHHFSSSLNPQPQSPPLQNTTHHCQHNAELNPESKAHPSLSLQPHANFCSPPHGSSDSLSSGSCPHKTTPPTNGHLPCSSQTKSNNSHSHAWHFSPLLSQSGPNLNSLPCSNVCPHALQSIQHKSNSNLKTLLLPSFHPGCQTNPNTLRQPDSDPRHQLPAVQSCGRPTLVSPAPLTLSHTERVLPVPFASTLSSTHHHPPSRMPSFPVTTHPPFPIPCSERPMSTPLKAGGVLLKLHQSSF